MYRVIHQVDGASLAWDSQRKVVRMTFIGIMDGDQYRLINRQLADFSDEHHVNAIVSNLINCSIVHRADLDWVAEHVTPKLIENGLRFVAFVLPSNIYGELSLKSFSEHLEQLPKVFIRNFDSLSNAEEWVDLVLKHS